MVDEKENLNQWICLSKELAPSFEVLIFKEVIFFPVEFPVLNVLTELGGT